MIEHLLTPLICPRFLSDGHYRQGHLNILRLPEGTKVLGVHNPEMQALARELASRPDAKRIISEFPLQKELCYEEQMVWGLMLCYIKCPLSERLALYRIFIPHINNWAVCDSVCSKSKWLRHKATDQSVVRAFIAELLSDSREFVIRFGIVLCLSYYIDNDRLPAIFGSFDRLYLSGAHNYYYVRMAIAWFLATSLWKCPDATRRYASSGSLPPEVMALYRRKVRESFRTRDMNPLL